MKIYYRFFLSHIYPAKTWGKTGVFFNRFYCESATTSGRYIWRYRRTATFQPIKMYIFLPSFTYIFFGRTYPNSSKLIENITRKRLLTTNSYNWWYVTFRFQCWKACNWDSRKRNHSVVSQSQLFFIVDWMTKIWSWRQEDKRLDHPV